MKYGKTVAEMKSRLTYEFVGFHGSANAGRLSRIEERAKSRSYIGALVLSLLLFMMWAVYHLLDAAPDGKPTGVALAGIGLALSFGVLVRLDEVFRSYTLSVHRCGEQGPVYLFYRPKGVQFLCRHCPPKDQRVLEIPIGGLQNRLVRWRGVPFRAASTMAWIFEHWQLQLASAHVAELRAEGGGAVKDDVSMDILLLMQRGNDCMEVELSVLLKMIESKELLGESVYGALELQEMLFLLAEAGINKEQKLLEKENERSALIANHERVEYGLREELAGVMSSSRERGEKLRLLLDRLEAAIRQIEGTTRFKNSKEAQGVQGLLMRAYCEYCEDASNPHRREFEAVLALRESGGEARLSVPAPASAKALHS